MKLCNNMLLALAALALLLAAALPAMADVLDPAVGEEVPGEEADSYLDTLNDTQLQRIENLASASFDPKDYESLAEALEAVEQAELDLEAAIAADDPDAIALAEQALADARLAAEDGMSEALGAAAEEIAAMREDGMGWGVICHELGLHPSVLGMGHTNRYRETIQTSGELEDGEAVANRANHGQGLGSTDRNLGGGVAKGHGMRSDGESISNNGRGNGRALSMADKGVQDTENNGRGNGNGNGVSNGVGSSGNNGNHGGGNNGNHGGGNNGNGHGNK